MTLFFFFFCVNLCRTTVDLIWTWEPPSALIYKKKKGIFTNFAGITAIFIHTSPSTGNYGNKQEINLIVFNDENPSSLKLIYVTKCFLPPAEGGCSKGTLPQVSSWCAGLRSGDWVGSWIISRFFALRKSWIVFAVCFGLLCICTVKQRPLLFFAAFGWIWATSEFLLLLAAVNSQEKNTSHTAPLAGTHARTASTLFDR